MTQIHEGTINSLADVQVNQIVKRVLHTARLAAHKAVAHASDPRRYPISSDPSSLERKFLARLKTRKADELGRAVSRTRSFLTLSTAERSGKLGNLAAVDLRATASVDEQVRAIALPAGLRMERARADQLIANPHLLFDSMPAPAAPAAAELRAQDKLDKLELRIRKVRCADETDGAFGSEAGDDEILLGGTAIDESGATAVIKPYTVALDFDDGESRTYDPARQFKVFNLREEGNVWPKTYYVSLIFCEEDNGGFPEWLEDLLLQLKGMVAPLIGTMIGAGIGSALIPIPGLGTVIGAAIGAILGSLIQLFIDIWEDDVFPAVTPWAAIRSYDHLFASGKHTSDVKYFAAGAHGGKYECWYDWRVTT